MTAAPDTLVDLLRSRAAELPDRLAFTFLANGETEEASFTHATLDTRARAIGAWLNSIAPAGERALLLYPSGPEFVAAFFGCLYGGLVAVPAYPLDPARLPRTIARLRTIIASAQPAVALTTEESLRTIEALMPDHPDLRQIRWIATESIPDSHAAEWRVPAVDRDTLALLQYTSGSTTEPRGVKLSHGNVLENEQMMQTAFGYTDKFTFVSWVPLAHDLGLFGHVVLPLFVGGPSILMTPEAFLQKPLRWLQAIARYPDAATSAPNFAYELCVRRIGPEDRKNLDLTNWRTADVGGEPVRPDTLERFVAAFGPCGFRREVFVSGYGLAEATVFISESRNPRVLRVCQAELERNNVIEERRDDVPGHCYVSVGRPAAGQTLAIVDPDTLTAAAPGRVGEIWVSGGNVGQGYWNLPEETERIFQAMVADTREGPFLRTGDLGFLHGGEIFVTGRLKDLIILRGRNYYPQDFELTVESCHKALRPGGCAAFAIEADGEERLAIVQELRDSTASGLEDVIAAIRRAVFQEHEVAAYAVALVPAGSVPKTSSGKLQRRACRTAYLAGALSVIEQSVLSAESGNSVVEPRTPREKSIARIWSEVLNIEKVGIHDSFFDLGGDSIAAARCLAEICAQLDIEQVSPAILLYASTVAQLAEALRDPARDAEVLPIQPHGAGVPLVLVAPGMESRGLAQRLGPGRPLFGVLTPSLEHAHASRSIKQIAAECVTALRRFRPLGPYALGGWCAAGTVALEMARQLEESGAQIAFVAMFDAREVLAPPMTRPQRAVTRSWRFAQRLALLGSRVRQQGPGALRDAVTSRIGHAREIVRRNRQGLPPSHSDALTHALRRWSPDPWPGRTLHLWAVERPAHRGRNLKSAWDRLSPNGAFYDVPGDHHSMLQEPNVARVAEILASELDAFVPQA